MNKVYRLATILVVIVAAGAIWLKFFAPLVSTQVETVEIPAVESVSDGQLIPPEELKAAGDKLVAGATDFGSDCAAAEDYFHATGGDARCKQEGSDLEVIISSKALPKDPAELSAEQPAAP